VLRQISRLGRSVPSAGNRALAVAVYADSGNTPKRAQEAGYEGVACVDDAARALELYCDLWNVTRLPWALRWCEGLLDFILAMQDVDGRWLNFILDWEGNPNREGRTSVAGGAFWQARAVLALARASTVLSDDRIDGALRRGLDHIVVAVDVPSDVRVLHVKTALLLNAKDVWPQNDLLDVWSNEIMSCRRGDVLMNSAYEEGQPHLWGHIQEGVLADAGVRLGRQDLINCARRSADLVFPGVVADGFNLSRTQPYDVASAVYSLSRLADVTGIADYAALAGAARAWFDGRNAAGQAVYDRAAGRVADGVDGRHVSTQSGAEANIVAAQTLFEDTVTLARRLSSSEALPAAIHVANRM